jgi:outer membrane protein assembly factor BamB
MARSRVQWLITGKRAADHVERSGRHQVENPLPGMSGATPAVWGDSIFVSSPDEQKNLLLLCVNRKDGSVRWQKQIATGNIEQGKGNMASPSPVTDGKAVYVLYGTGDIAALDFEGQILWQRNLGEDYGRFAIMWIYGSSPLLYDGRLYVQVLQRSPAPGDYPGNGGRWRRSRELSTGAESCRWKDAVEACASDGCAA